MASAVKRLIMGNNNNCNGNSALLVCLMYGNGSFLWKIYHQILSKRLQILLLCYFVTLHLSYTLHSLANILRKVLFCKRSRSQQNGHESRHTFLACCCCQMPTCHLQSITSSTLSSSQFIESALPAAAEAIDRFVRFAAFAASRCS